MTGLKQWILISLMAGAWVVTGRAQDAMEMAPVDRPGPGPGMGMREGRLRAGGEDAGLQDILRDPETVKELALDEKQIEKLKALHTQSQKDMIDWNAKLQHSALGLADLMGQETPNEEAVLKAFDETSQIRSEISKLRIKQLFAVRAILTPEQRLKARERMKTKMSERQKAGGKKGAKGAKGGERGIPPPNPPLPQE